MTEDVGIILEEAQTLHKAGHWAKAEAKCNEILRQNSQHPQALYLLGIIYLLNKDFTAATSFLERAVSYQPNTAEMHVNLGAAYRANGETTKAVEAYQKALVLDSNLSATYFNLGHALKELGALEEAINAYKAYIAKEPQDAEALTILGDTYMVAGYSHDAIDAYESALNHDPHRTRAISNTSIIMRNKGWHHAAHTIIERAIELAPLDHDIRQTYSVACLQFGDFENGWAALESRFDTENERIVRRSSPPAYWNNEDLDGKNVVVWTEQGLGDEALYSSILPEVISRVAHCTIECSKRMAPVFMRSFPSATVIGYEASNFPVMPADGFDYQIPMASLGLHFRPDFSSFPRHEGYLKSDPDKVAKIRTRYESLANGRRIVGLSWRSKNELVGKDKSIALVDLANILQVPDIMFVNLQSGDCTEELANVSKQLGVEVVQDAAVDPLTDMDMFFAQVAAMDLVLSTSNTTVHVAGSQNIPVWVLLPHGKGLAWYWFLQRRDSPWYPAARLNRADHKLEAGQTQWLELATRCATDLTQWAGA